MLAKRKRQVEPEPEPTPVTTGRATVIDVPASAFAERGGGARLAL